MLGAVSARLGQEKVRDQFVHAAGRDDLDPGSFAGRLGAVASERRLSLLLCLGNRPRRVKELAGLCGFDGVWSICCATLAPAVERLVPLVLTTPSAKEAT
jgi:hypothetical protein